MARTWNGPGPVQAGPGPQLPRSTRTTGTAGASVARATDAITWNTPSFTGMTADAQVIAAEWFQLGYGYGHDAGLREGLREYYQLPDVGTAVQSLKALGTLGITRREAERRRQEGDQ